MNLDLCDEKIKKKCDSFYKKAFLERSEYLNKLKEENKMLKSNDILNNQKIKDLKKKYEKEIAEYKNKIKILEERVSSLEYKQVDMFGEV